MDELLIGEKTYVSSKRAAKITGYAKDYIGQLCREGRVPARLVGRSWYVLQSALEDHRFGTAHQQEGGESKEKGPESRHGTWEAPRYEAAPGEMLPPAPRTPEPEEVKEVAAHTPEQSLHESWQAWFSRIGEAPTPIEADEIRPEEAETPAPETPEKSEENTNEEEVPVTIHAIHHTPLHERLSPQGEEEELDVRILSEERRAPYQISYRKVGVIRFVSMALALISLSLAVAGSGYIDNYVISFNQAHLMAGVSVYNK